MRFLVITFFALINCSLFSQTPDPYKFFPSSVGNVWEYTGNRGYRAAIYRDSIDINGYRHLFFRYDDYNPPYATFKIDTLNYLFYYTPFSLNWLYYKIDADTGEVWIVDSLNPGVGTIYMLALCRNQYEGYFYGHSTTFKEVTFYQYQADTTLNEFSWPDYTITLAYGIGEVMEFDEKGGGPQRILQGCIIDGDTIGIITSVEEEFISINSYELFQNYPNPFNPTTTIKFSIAEPQKVKLIVYSLLGEEIKILVDDYKPAGNYAVIFNASEIVSGVYIYTLITGNQSTSKKLILLK
jgi:hypothetical protein